MQKKYFINTFQDPEDLQDMMNDVFRQGLEGLVLKDLKVRYRHVIPLDAEI